MWAFHLIRTFEDGYVLSSFLAAAEISPGNSPDNRKAAGGAAASSLATAHHAPVAPTAVTRLFMTNPVTFYT
jgi:hypothetical protein